MLLPDKEIKQLIISAGWILTGAKLNHMIADYKVALQVQHERSSAAGRRELVEWLESPCFEHPPRAKAESRTSTLPTPPRYYCKDCHVALRRKLGMT